MAFNRYALLLHLLIFVSIADSTGVMVGGVTIRAAWIFAPFLYILLKSKSINSNEFFFISVFSFFHLISALFNSSYIGLTYVLWLLFNFFVFYMVGASNKISLNVDLTELFLVSGRMQILLGSLFVLINQHERLTFTYYEPSYMAVGLIPYLVFSIMMSKVSKIDLFCIALFVVLGQSALFLIFFLVTLIAKLISLENKAKVVLTILIILLSGILFFIDSYNNESRVNHIVVKTLVDEGVDIVAILERAGNRFPRMEAAYKVFVENIYIGIGPGNYSSYISGINFDDVTKGIPWHDVHGQPPVNIFIEAGINSGIIGLFFLFLVFFKFSFELLRSGYNKLFLIITLIFIAGLIEANYLRAYCWLFFGIVAGQLQRRCNVNSLLKNKVDGEFKK